MSTFEVVLGIIAVPLFGLELDEAVRIALGGRR